MFWGVVNNFKLFVQKSLCSTSAPVQASGPPNRLNAILSLLRLLDRYRTPSAIGRAVRLGGPYLALSRTPTQVGVLSRLVLNRLGGLNRAMVVL